jgi:isoleucyl-tRNA synthetase
MYRETKQLNLPEIDREIQEFWKKEEIFKKSIESRDRSNSYVFYEGPPSANGKPGIHHVMARTVKDLFCRYHTLKGKRVERKAGWDTHGLPVELKVEQEMGITKEDIGKSVSIAEYNQKCRETVMRYKGLWDDLTEKMGYWVDLENPYITYENDYIESVWWLLKQLHSKNMLYKGYTIQPYSPAAGTGLSSHELNQPGAYRDVKDTSVVAMFKIIKNEDSEFLYQDVDEDVRLIAWTTTPWTLPSNTALTVGPKIKYVKIKTQNPYTDEPVSIVLATDLVKKWLGGKKQPEILEQSEPFIGKSLVNIRYEQLLDFGNPIEPLQEATDAFRVIPGNFVTTEDGTGIVHTAPSFGADDRMVAKENGIGALTLVDKQGKFISNAGPFSGRYVKNYKEEEDYVNVDIDISVKLKKEGKAFNVAKYSHNYPHCWRTDKPILYYPLDSWFIKASKVKERMFELNQTINWKPKSTGEGRFGKWLENLQDWNLSRSRYWGIPLPIWRNEAGNSEKCVGSVEELAQEIKKANDSLGLNQEVPSDLHRPYIDEIVLVDDEGNEMKRELDLIDVWFDSGSMPYAQWHYPFENKDKWKSNFPADFIAEGVDQTRGWFYTLHAIGTMVFDSVAYKNVVSNGLVLDKNGVKMSKRLGNVIDPFKTMDTYGADALRWYMMSNSAPWDNLKFDVNGVVESRNKFFGTLFNTYKFFAQYANVDQYQYDPEKTQDPTERRRLDRWICSKLNTVERDFHEFMTDYDCTPACRLLEDFVLNDLSNWYVRLSRRIFWKSNMSPEKQAAYDTLFECLLSVSKMMSSVAPHFGDWLFQSLTQDNQAFTESSVHLTVFDQQLAYRNPELEQNMDYAQRISSLALSLRKKENIRVRQPLQKIILPVLDQAFKSQVEKVRDLILQEINVKEIEYIEDTEGVINKKIKPNFKTLGKMLGKNMKGAAQIIAQFDQKTIAKIEKEGKYILELDEDTYELNLEDFEITAENIPGLKVAADRGLTVALDVELTEVLLQEGLAKEIVNRIQNLRKDQDFEITDRIEVKISSHPSVEAALSNFGEYVRQEVLANSIEISDFEGETFDLVDEVRVAIEVKRI